MFASGLGASWQTLAVVAICTAGAYLALIMFSRVAGLRSFAQMTNFDMAATIAFGSMVATTSISTSTPLLAGAVGLAVLFVIQWVLAYLRRHRTPEKLVDSSPLLLMIGGRVLHEHLITAQMTRSDLHSKLRLAGVTRYDQVGAVVLEVTGAVSVLTTGPDDLPMEPELFARVRGREQLFPGHDFVE